MTLTSAVEAYKKGKYASAIEICATLCSCNPPSADVLLLLGAAFYQTGDFARCVAANDAAIILNPNIPEAHANLANALQQLGSLDLAIMYYTSALQLKPSFADAYANLGAAYVQKGWTMQAVQAFTAALTINPSLAEVRCSLGDVWRCQGEAGRSAAVQCFASALETDAQCATAWRGLGECARENGEFERAIECFNKAIELSPMSAEAHTGLGMTYRDMKIVDRSEKSFEAALKLRPTCPLALGNLAGAYYEGKKLEKAIQLYHQALAVQPSFPEALNNLGNALREVGRLPEAISSYTKCIQLQLNALATPPLQSMVLSHPPHALGAACATHTAQRLSVTYNNLGGVLKLVGRTAECIAAYQQVALLQPLAPEAHANLGSAFKDSGRHEEAISSYQRALSLRSDFPEAFGNLVHSKQCICDWMERDVLFTRLQKEVERDLEAGKLPAVQPFHAMTYPFSAQLALSISKRYAVECLKAARALPGAQELVLSHPPAKVPLFGSGNDQRLRVGYVSSDFGNHPLAHLMGSVFGMQDRSRIEVFCYSLSPNDGSEWRFRIENEAEHFLDVSQWTAVDIARRISQDGIHIAVNLNGYTKGARNEVFAMRPAPVQVSYLGFPATMGADYIQWIVLDKVVCPPESRQCYSESIAYMPHTYFVNDYRRSNPEVLDSEKLPTRASVGLPENAIIYSCANQLYKYDPRTFDAWCNILKRVPNSVLWLLRFPPAGEMRIRREALARGVDPDRIVFTDVAPKPLHVARSGLADVFLDTPFCNAHTTGCDVLWGGCPMVTLPLERMASRVAASLCTATGFGSVMIAKDWDDYEERAVALGLDAEARTSLCGAVRAARTSCPLFDTKRFVKNFDNMLIRMWGIHCKGHGPRDFEVEEGEGA